MARGNRSDDRGRFRPNQVPIYCHGAPQIAVYIDGAWRCAHCGVPVKVVW